MDCVGAISSISVHHYQHVVFLLFVLLSGLIIQPFVDDLRDAYGKDRSEDDEDDDDDNSLKKKQGRIQKREVASTIIKQTLVETFTFTSSIPVASEANNSDRSSCRVPAL